MILFLPKYFSYRTHLMTITFPGRTIVGLWRTRTLSSDQQAQIAEDQDNQEERSKMLEDTEVTESILNLEDTKMSKIYTTEIPVNVSLWFFSLLLFLR